MSLESTEDVLRTYYSDEYGSADYYAWSDGYARDECGYFVSLAEKTLTIKICERSDIFGVTVSSAAFIGNQSDKARSATYALVVTKGCVDVRCETDVEVGDYVVSNAYGIAEKTNSTYGYKVIAKEDKFGVDYAVIALGVQADKTDLLGKAINLLDTRMGDAEINIAAAINVANEAHNKAVENTASNEAMNNQLIGALDKVDDMSGTVGDLDAQVGKFALIATQAQAIAETAATSAESARVEAVTTANEALDKAGELEKTVEPISSWTYTDPVTGETNTGATYFAEYVANSLSTKAEMETVSKLDEENKLLIEKNAENYRQMLSSVDRYSVGEYSQAYGLTLSQARNILKEGMIYIPTPHEGADTHLEKYADGEDILQREFTHGFYYVWTLLNNGTYMWSESIGEVWFGTEQPAGTAYDYWYDGDKLFLLQDDGWTEVATLAGNVNNRLTSMLRQEVDEISLEIANARGSVASLTERLTDTEAEVQSLALWSQDADGNQYNLATIKQTADEAGASVAQVVESVGADGKVTAASIVTAVNNDTSGVIISGDRINLNGRITISDLNKETQELIELDTIDVQIWSSRGNIFKSRDVSTILTCHVFKAGVEITNALPNSAFTWEKINDNGTVDTEWRATPYGNNANAIQITAADIFSRAVFNCAVEI